MRATETTAGKKKATKIKALAVALLVIVPIGSFYVFVGPEFEISITQSWGRVTNETTEIRTVIAVNNPTSLARSLKKIEFDLYMNDLKIASEVSEKSMEVKPMGKTEKLLTSFLNNNKIPDLWITYLNKGNLFDVKLTGNITFGSTIREIVFPIGYETSTHTNLLELLNIKESKDIIVGSDTLTLKSLTLAWGEVTSAQTEINNGGVIYNPNSYPITIKKINCTIEMNGIKIGEGSTYNPTALEAKTDSNISFTAILNNTMLNKWWATHLRNDQITRVVVKLQGTAEVLRMEYGFPIAEVWEEVSIRILGATISLGYYVPTL